MCLSLRNVFVFNIKQVIYHVGSFFFACRSCFLKQYQFCHHTRFNKNKVTVVKEFVEPCTKVNCRVQCKTKELLLDDPLPLLMILGLVAIKVAIHISEVADASPTYVYSCL